MYAIFFGVILFIVGLDLIIGASRKKTVSCVYDTQILAAISPKR